MAKASTPRAARNKIADKSAALNALFDAVVSNAQSDDTMKAAFIAAGGNQDEPRKVVIVARIAHSLSATKETALLAFNKKGNPKLNTKHADDVRSPKEEKAYGAARVFLSSRLKVWGIKTASKQGGDRTGDNSRMTTEKLKPAPKPRIENSVELGAYCMAYATAGYDLFLLNKAHEAVTSPHGSELMGAFADFVNTVKDINAKHNKA